MTADAVLYVDESHLGRHVTGLERITLELFSAAALASAPQQSTITVFNVSETQTTRLQSLVRTGMP